MFGLQLSWTDALKLNPNHLATINRSQECPVMSASPVCCLSKYTCMFTHYRQALD